jgi:ferritin-like metal-binding protein YciE
LVNLSSRLGMDEVAAILQSILDEEQASSKLLNEIAADDEAINNAYDAE